MTATQNPSGLGEDARLDVAGATDIGKARQDNEDQYLIARLTRVVDIEATSIALEGMIYV